MIAEAIHQLLSDTTTITDLVGNRISPVNFRELEVFPGITHNNRRKSKDDDPDPYACRAYSDSISRIVRIGILANSSLQLEQVSDAVYDALSEYTGVHGEYQITTEFLNEGFDEQVTDLKAYHKVLQFDFTATKL